MNVEKLSPSEAYTLGVDNRKDGHSISYNPYRHRKCVVLFSAWIDGWNAADERTRK